MPTDTKPPFRRERTMKGHSAGIQCIAISPDGTIALSGDDDAFLFVWNLRTGEATQKISNAYHGAIGAVVWVKMRDSNALAFVFGCADGSLHVFKEKLATKGTFDSISVAETSGPIEDLAFDISRHRLASVGGGCLRVWDTTDEGSLVPLNDEIVQRPVVAKSVFFFDEGASVVVFYLESHVVECYSVEPWSLKWSKLLRTRIGHASICSADGTYVYVTNLVDGVDQYRFPSLEKVQSFTHPISANFPLQVASAGRGQWIVSGGDSGFARVFSRQSGQVLQILKHSADSDVIQAVATHETENGAIIITGRSSEGDSDLHVWTGKSAPVKVLDGVSGAEPERRESLQLKTRSIVILTFFAIVVIEAILLRVVFASSPWSLLGSGVSPTFGELVNRPVTPDSVQREVSL